MEIDPKYIKELADANGLHLTESQKNFAEQVFMYGQDSNEERLVE